MTVEQSSRPVVVFMAWRGEPQWGGKSQGAPSLSDVLSAVFKLCRHLAPVWTKPAKTTEQKIPCVFV